MKNKSIKSIYKLGLHETLVIEEIFRGVLSDGSDSISKKYEVTRVPGGWVYAFDYPNFRQSPIVFVPFNEEYK